MNKIVAFKPISTFWLTALAMLFFGVFATPSSAQDGQDSLIVEADISLQWQREQSQYIATGNASAQRGAAKLTADVITADYSTDDSTKNAESTDITVIKGLGNARFSRNDTAATAAVITYDLTTEFVTLNGGSPEIVNLNDRITAKQTITYNRKKRIITATSMSQITLADGNILKGDSITATLNPEENDIINIVATGNAEIFSPPTDGVPNSVKVAYADTMTYQHATGIAILTGNVRLEENENVITGARAEINVISGVSTMSAEGSGTRVGGIFKPAE